MSDSDSFLGERYTDDKWAVLLELAERLGVSDRMDRASPQANRDIILDRFGYAPSWSIENGLMGLVQSWFTNCRRCGATLPLREAEEGCLTPLDQHTHWHVLIECVAPNGQQVKQ